MDESGMSGMGTFELTQAEIDEFAHTDPGPNIPQEESLLAHRRHYRAAYDEPVPIVEKPRPVQTKWQGKFKVPASLRDLPSTDSGGYHFHQIKYSGRKRPNPAQKMAESNRNGTNPIIAKQIDHRPLKDSLEWRLDLDKRTQAAGTLDTRQLPYQLQGAINIYERDRPSMAFRSSKRKPLWSADQTGSEAHPSKSERQREAAKQPVNPGRIRKRNALQQKLLSESTPELPTTSSFHSDVPRFRGVDSMNDLFWRPSCQN